MTKRNGRNSKDELTPCHLCDGCRWKNCFCDACRDMILLEDITFHCENAMRRYESVFTVVIINLVFHVYFATALYVKTTVQNVIGYAIVSNVKLKTARSDVQGENTKKDQRDKSIGKRIRIVTIGLFANVKVRIAV